MRITRKGVFERYNRDTWASVFGPCLLSEIATKTLRKSLRRRLWRIALVGLLALAVLGLVAPFIDASRLGAPIERALETSLGRKVEFEKVHFTLFSGPGFFLESVIIGEDPRFGLEPFAYVPTLEARVRLDKLLLGRIMFSSLRLVDPNLNLVKRSDGTWNVVALVERLSAPRRAPLNLFPSFEVSGGRIDFKFGVRKTTLYISDSDLSIYPQRSGKLYIQFSGSPARTDRAGNGFGHLRGSATWYLNPRNAADNRLDADVTLDPSNLSEITTLVEGHDIGVHGTISSRARIEGPATALNISGQLRLDDVHRWDLLPSSGEDWQIRYRGGLDLFAHSLDLETAPWRAGEVNPVALTLRVGDFLSRPDWSVSAQFNKAPLQNLLPLGRRMGLSLPEELAMTGTVEGRIGYSSGTGISGQVAIRDAAATLPNIPPLHTELATASISADRIHLDPSEFDTANGVLHVGGDYFLSKSRVDASLETEDFPIDALKNTIQAWFGTPDALAILNAGNLTGSLAYVHQQDAAPVWSGQFQFTDSTLHAPGIAIPLGHLQGRVSFSDTSFDLAHFSGSLGGEPVQGKYRYTAGAKHPERLHLEMPAADLDQIEKALAPALEAQGLLARLRLSRRSIPAWLATRNLNGDISVGQFSINSLNLGPLAARFSWQGTNLRFTALQLNLPEGLIRAQGTVNMASYVPRFRFSAKATGFPWRGGLLSADGQFQSSGTGLDSLQNLHASGNFSADDVTLSAGDAFNKISGGFEFSFADGWPDLRLSKVEASDGEEAWNGAAISQSDGKLILELEHAGRQRRVVSSLVPAPAPAVSELLK